jgi:hypothetical protein
MKSRQKLQKHSAYLDYMIRLYSLLSIFKYEEARRIDLYLFHAAERTVSVKSNVQQRFKSACGVLLKRLSLIVWICEFFISSQSGTIFTFLPLFLSTIGRFFYLQKGREKKVPLLVWIWELNLKYLCPKHEAMENGNEAPYIWALTFAVGEWCASRSVANSLGTLQAGGRFSPELEWTSRWIGKSFAAGTEAAVVKPLVSTFVDLTIGAPNIKYVIIHNISCSV